MTLRVTPNHENRRTLGGIDYDDAIRDATMQTMDGVAIPLASPATLIRTKQTVRPSDAADRRYLEELLRAEGEK